MKKIIIAILLFFAAVFFMLQYYFSDVQINKYPDKESAIEKGWIPQILPDSAYDIEETHDIDTNQLFGRFYYKPKDEKILMVQLDQMPEQNGTYIGKHFLFKIDSEKHLVQYRNKTQ